MTRSLNFSLTPWILIIGMVTIQASIIPQLIGVNSNEGISAILLRVLSIPVDSSQTDLGALVSHQAPQYNITAKIKEKPTSQPAKMVLMVMSFFVARESVTQQISDSIIDCLASETSTNSSNWGLFGADRFADAMFQVEYYAFVHIDSAITFRAQVTAYSANKTLRACVRSKVPSFSANANILAGRRVTEAMPNDVKEVTGGIPSWVIGAIAGGMVLVTLIAVIFATVQKTRVFSPIVFEDDYAYQPTHEDEEARAAAELENELRAIASGFQ